MGHTAGMGGDDDFDYSSLDVGPDVRDLFEHIGQYKPHSIELEVHLKPFVPDFLPALGDTDAFLKVGRPDSQEEVAGLVTVDEPTAAQSIDVARKPAEATSSLQPWSKPAHSTTTSSTAAGSSPRLISIAVFAPKPAFNAPRARMGHFFDLLSRPSGM